MKALRWLRDFALVATVVVLGANFPLHGRHSETSAASAAPVVVSKASIYAAALARERGRPGLPRLMLIGNSVAYELSRGFAALDQATVFDAAIPACAFPPTINASYRNPVLNQELVEAPCHPAGEVDEAEAFKPSIVLWVVSDPPEPWSYRGQRVHACSEPYDSAYKLALGNEVARMQRAGARVVLTTEAYVRFTNAGLGLDALALPDRTVDCNNDLRRAVAKAAHVQLVDLFSWTCPRGRCITKLHGVTLRPDGVHYAGPGGAIAAQWILDKIDG